VVEKAGVPLLIGFNRRYDPSFRNLEQRLRGGEIGDVEMLTIISRDPAPPPVSYIARSGGLYRDMMIHDFDMARFLLGDGDEIVSVHAMGSVLTDPAIKPTGDVDTVVVITNSRRAAYGYDQRIEAHGSKGMLRAGNIHMTTVERADASGFTADVIQNFFIDRYASAYAAEIAAFLDCMEKGTKPKADGHDGLMAQKLAEAATVSSKTGQVVKVG
jgi:myo-inositol 2-dehydrogenase/D-chiro-inositol 1-dehydrogenase